MEQKAGLILPQDVETLLDREDIMKHIQNIFLTSRLRNQNCHPIISSPYSHLEIHNKDEGLNKKNVQDIHSVPF